MTLVGDDDAPQPGGADFCACETRARCGPFSRNFALPRVISRNGIDNIGGYRVTRIADKAHTDARSSGRTDGRMSRATSGYCVFKKRSASVRRHAIAVRIIYVVAHNNLGYARRTTENAPGYTLNDVKPREIAFIVRGSI